MYCGISAEILSWPINICSRGAKGTHQLTSVPSTIPEEFPQYLDISHNAWRFCNEGISDGEIKEWFRPRLSTEAQWDLAIHHSSCLKWPFSGWGFHPQPSQDTQYPNCTVIACYIGSLQASSGDFDLSLESAVFAGAASSSSQSVLTSLEMNTHGEGNWIRY